MYFHYETKYGHHMYLEIRNTNLENKIVLSAEQYYGTAEEWQNESNL